jgi:hypothetical protein
MEVDYWLFQKIRSSMYQIEDGQEMSGIIFHLEELLAYCHLHYRSITELNISKKSQVENIGGE